MHNNNITSKIIDDFETINQELTLFSEEIYSKKNFLVFNKIDLWEGQILKLLNATLLIFLQTKKVF